MAELPHDVIEVINKEALADIIPTNYKVGDNGWLYKEVEKGKGDNAKVVPVLITSTTPYISKKYKDIETGEFTYQLKFNSAEKENKHTVLARDLADATHIINLADRVLM